MKVLIISVFFLLIFYQVQCQNNKLSPRLALGDVVPSTDQKSTAALISKQNVIECSGAFIHSKWILTTAWCGKQARALQWRIIPGVNVDLEKENYVTGIPWNDIKIYPYYNEKTMTNDLALIELTEHVAGEIIPLIIPDLYRDLTRETLIVKGYGRSSGLGPVIPDGKLRKASVVIGEDWWCRSLVPMQPNKICASKPVACKGDNGGPLMDENYNLLGLISVTPLQADLCEALTIPVSTYQICVPYKSWIKTTTKAPI